ncbi:MAG: integrase [Acidimicrobiaceae bacterium]|nr:integrase [Acidimicrobiaceae bacterium]
METTPTNQQASPPELWSEERLREHLGCPKSYVDTICRQARLPYIRIGRARRFVPKDVAEFVEREADSLARMRRAAARSKVTRSADRVEPGTPAGSAPRSRGAGRGYPGVRRVQNGNWEARIMINGQSYSNTFPDEAAAAEWHLKMKRRSARGTAPVENPNVITLGEWWDRWRAGRMVRPNTEVRETSAYRAHIEPRWGRTPIARIKKMEAQAWVRQLSEVDNLAPATVARIVGIIGTCYESAVASDLVDRNPFRGLNLPEREGEEARFVTGEEARRIEVAMDPHWSLTIPVMFEVGLRIGELAGLRVRDVRFARPNHVVSVREVGIIGWIISQVPTRDLISRTNGRVMLLRRLAGGIPEREWRSLTLRDVFGTQIINQNDHS